MYLTLVLDQILESEKELLGNESNLKRMLPSSVKHGMRYAFDPSLERLWGF
jgi:hypothetical protein